ncbi:MULTISPECIES: SDR family NAD(P)-dependent oxidoreductase [Arthrobacter]|uniref:SDR family NAD(P)-dependent oxidoreductase n=2 Tax=Arthrobacter TaxID=1663 RepID=A0ABU9KIN8_9MICC|nr:SDR family NAD(P)-dependent oxidoreductase [Arthrobacter sp. YJM1]MDP5225794.1 SDR family NAD(P)-dependent oxidoreductase [Arthrobacter sp. YJM1]
MNHQSFGAGTGPVNLGLDGRRAVVTGAASGIGRAVTSALLVEGCTVYALDRDAAALNRLGEELRASGLRAGLTCLTVDLRDESAVVLALSTAGRDGGLDVLVSCAGVSGPVGTPLEATSAEDWRQVMEVNVMAPFLVLKHAFPLLRQGRDPAVVLLGSDSALVAAPRMAPYCASKAAVIQLGRALAVEWAEHRIRVNSVCPSVVDTPMSRADLERPEGFGGTAFPVQSTAQVAAQVLILLSPILAPVNGTTLLSDFAFSARSGFPA